jgi:hypothetical protein
LSECWRAAGCIHPLVSLDVIPMLTILVEGRSAGKNRLEQLFVATWSSSPDVEGSGSRNHAGNDNGLEYTGPADPSSALLRGHGVFISFTYLKTR